MMQDSNPYSTTLAASKSAKKYSERFWFAIGFLIGFVVLLFSYQSYYTGYAVIVCPLWQYYLIEAKNGFPSLTGTRIGGSGNPIVATMAIHFAISAVIGLSVNGVRWIVRTVTSRKTNSQHKQS
jgi:hypothetical protein